MSLMLDQEAMHDYKNLFKKPVILEVSPNDTMYTGILYSNNDESYLNTGYSALLCIRSAMIAADKEGAQKILDFACGHGRVLRMLRAYFPNAQITACDIDRDGVDFCAKSFDSISIYSKERPEQIEIKEKFDIIWVGSLFTHLDQNRWHQYLQFLIDHLNHEGLLVFTTHGRVPVEWIRCGVSPYELTAKQIYGLEDDQFKEILKAYDCNGFGYVDYPTLKDFGISFSTPSWVIKQLEKFSNIQLVLYLEQGWGHHHDVVACRKFV